MEKTPNLAMPYILPSQAQKHVTHNEALQLLDAVVQLSVLDRHLTAPPAAPLEGARFIVASGASGAWAGQAGKIASYVDAAWNFYAPMEGWLAWVADEDVLLAWNGSAWSAVSSGGDVTQARLADGTVKNLGVNTLSDNANRLAVKGNAVLFSHDDVTPGTGDIRATLNKKAAANDAGFVFQTAWSTRAQLGLAGDNSFTIKVSSNGSSFTTGLNLRPEDGHVGLAGYTADANNDLGVKGTNVLFDRRTDHMRINLNKAASASDAGFCFQTGYSARALLGLYGDDNFVIKVSPDGSRWNEALRIDAATGKADLPSSSMLTSFAINLYPDSGRFAGNGAVGVTVGAFAFPNYMTLYNGSTVKGAGKFINDNNDYGGAAGALVPTAKDLVDKIRDPGYRRNGVEFWIAEITMGSSTAAATSYNGTTYYYSAFTRQQIRAPAHTFHAYVRAVDSAVLVMVNPSATVFKNGVEHRTPNQVIIAPSEGWVSITIQDSLELRSAYGYLPMIFGLYAQKSGDRWQIACPALMGGLTRVPDDSGVIAGANSWS
ncbi:DUF2793 domain-containing protein [Brucella sp. IR073]|uniref:DUF2793 domain-containing protein n=1 Tax=unclassified Brucella TaxID=2632610 RepID=UPI003B981622